MKRLILIVTVITAAIMELIDTSIVNVALNYMSGNLGASMEDISWVVTAYAIANVIVIPMTSFLVNNLGRRNYYIGSIILFTICSFMCGNSTNIWELVAFRFLQGIGGGALLSVSAVVVYECFPREKQNIASALFGIGVFIGPTIGPTLGGYITDNFSWPWIFYINLPIGIVTALICLRLLPESPAREKIKQIDWAGIFFLVIGIGSLQTVLERGETEDWFESKMIVILSITAAIALVLFIFQELMTSAPVVKLRILRYPSLSISAVLTFVTGLGMFTSIFLTPVLVQRFLGFSPTQAGLVLLPGSILAVFALIITGRALQHGVAPSLIVLIGFICFIYFNWAMSQINLDASADLISHNLIIRALGMALLTVPLSTLAISQLEPQDMAQGTAINNMMRQLGGSFGIALINTYIVRRTAQHRIDLISHVTADNIHLTQRIEKYKTLFLTQGLTGGDAERKAMGMLEKVVAKQSLFSSYLDAYILVGLLFLSVTPILLFFLKGNKPKKIVIARTDH